MWEWRWMGRWRDVLLGPSVIIFRESNHGSFYTIGKTHERKFFGVGNSVGTNFLWTKNKGLNYSSNPLFLFVVAGLGFEPRTFGLWARRATRLLHPASVYSILNESKVCVKNLFQARDPSANHNHLGGIHSAFNCAALIIFRGIKKRQFRRKIIFRQLFSWKPWGD